MDKEKLILLKFSLYILTFLVIIGIGVSNIFALSNYNQIQFFDNNGSSVSYKTTSWVQQTQESTATFGLTANSTGGLLVYMMSSPVVNNHIYSMFVNVGTRNYGGATQLSSKNCIGLGNSEWAAANDYIACTLTPRFSASSGSTSEYRKGLFFTFIANKNAGYIAIPFTSTETVYDVPIYSYGLEIEDNGDSTNMTQQEVSNIVDTQTDTLEETIANIESNVSSNILNSQQAIISNQNANNQALIQNDNTNTQNIINNNNTNTDKIIEDNKKNFQTCRDSLNLFNDEWLSNRYITSTDNYYASTYLGTQESHSITANETYTISSKIDLVRLFFVFYDSNNTVISQQVIVNKKTKTFTTPSNAVSYRLSFSKDNTTMNINDYKNIIQLQKGNTATDFEPYGEEICKNKLDEQTNAINGLNDNLNNDNTDGATSEASDFFSDFNTNTFGLTSIITAPLNLIQSLTSKTCSPLHLPLPYLNNKYLDLPCMSSIYSEHFGTFFTLYQTITYGIIAYWVCVRIFNHVKDFKNPEHDEIEVVDL